LIELFLRLQATFEACRRAGIVAVPARQLKPIEKLKFKLTTKSQITNVKLKPKPNSELLLMFTTSSHTCTKPHVA
jgi:hypothetical protein